MAKKRRTKPPLRARNDKPPAENTNDSTDPRRAKALILSALTAGGVFQMSTWQVQAHGNRSSHEMTSFQTPYFSPNDYVVMRQKLTAPNIAQANELAALHSSLAAVRGTAPAPGASQLKELEDRKTTLTNQLIQESSSMKPLAFVRQGDTPAAIAAIEGEGWPERVLGNYLWALLDVAYLGRRGDTFTTDDLNRFTAIAKPAVAYSTKLLGVLPQQNLSKQDIASKERCAEILHNVASFIVLPDTVADPDLQVATDAAQQALKIRMDLNQPSETMRANWMVGQVYLKGKQFDRAQRYLKTSLDQATKLKDQPGIAWAKYSLSEALRQSQPSKAKSYEADARQIAMNFQGQNTTIDFLRIELERKH